jgi:hypothetical protein
MEIVGDLIWYCTLDIAKWKELHIPPEFGTRLLVTPPQPIENPTPDLGWGSPICLQELKMETDFGNCTFMERTESHHVCTEFGSA